MEAVVCFPITGWQNVPPNRLDGSRGPFSRQISVVVLIECGSGIGGADARLSELWRCGPDLAAV